MGPCGSGFTREGSRATFYKGSFLSGDNLRQAARECLD
ncbi:protein of unknown function [Pseudomonas sp. JV551A1]|uniref:Uncharacterized protein n=1 Tax=Pseudomonas inefficax TaxID=2078786 RepID=A0AAQ1P975_9PSED|nr:protein of unknown function [Pseudomonas sp. JV551A1]SPO61383.1 protein of unknown function [Pseudomonas inefficax]